MKRFMVAFVTIVFVFTAGVSFAREPDQAGTGTTFEKALDELFTNGYPQQLVNYFCSLGTNPELGFRWAGTTAEHATGTRIEEEMRRMGLRRVRREPVPVDVFEFKRASLTFGSREMTCSAFAGVRPTPEGGITAPVVYVKGGTAADFDEAGDVSGKIVLIDYLPSSWWLSIPVFEAEHRQAAGVILTLTTEDAKYYSFHSQALGSFGSSGDLGLPPYVYMCLQDGDWLKSQLAQKEVRATMILDQEVTLARDGGVGYNVLGELPGSDHDGQMILLSAHQDAHFQGAIDNTTGFVNMLTIARAMCTSKVRPRHTIVFMATCGEEFGHINTDVCWLAGTWWTISHEHRDWIGKIRAVINMDSLGVNGLPVAIVSNPELRPWLTQLAASRSEYLPFGTWHASPVVPHTDQWPFTALGIPSVNIDTCGLLKGFGVYPPRYHTNFDTQDLIDWTYFAHIAKFIHVAIQELDDGLLPYSLEERAKDLATAVQEKELQAVGADPSILSRLVKTMKVFAKDASVYQTNCKSIPLDKLADVNSRLLAIERLLNDSLTALSPVDVTTVYPHQQVLADANGLKSALTALQGQVPDTRLALQVLETVGETKLGLKFSEAVYRRLLKRKNPNYENLYWASEGMLPIPVNVIPEYHAIQKGDIATAIAGLKAKHKLQIQELNKRLQAMTVVLKDANTLLRDIQAAIDESNGNH